MSSWPQDPGHPWIHVSDDVVIRVTYPETHTFEQTAALFDAVEILVAKADRPYAVVFDVGRMSRSDARGRARAAESEERIGAMPSVRAHCRGTVTVVRNAEQRGVLTSLAWRIKRPYPYLVVGTPEEADACVDELMGRAAGSSRWLRSDPRFSGGGPPAR